LVAYFKKAFTFETGILIRSYFVSYYKIMNDISKAPVWILSALRMLVGWHFLYEGIVKLASPSWSAGPYLLESTWVFVVDDSNILTATLKNIPVRTRKFF
jgi:hypothetical protein